MADRIEPALTAEEWAGRGAECEGYSTPISVTVVPGGIEVEEYLITTAALPKVIALANAALPDSDPRKITRAIVKALRKAVVSEPYAGSWTPDIERTDALHAWADALASYLPPEGP